MKLRYLLADTHVHLEHEGFAADAADVIARGREAGVRYMVVPVCAAADAARDTTRSSHGGLPSCRGGPSPYT